MDNLKREYSWMGYVGESGTVEIRNKVPVICTAECVSFVAREIVKLAGDLETEVVGFSGCTDNECTVRLLIALIRRPNMGAVLTTGPGCEYVQPEWLADIAGKEGEEAAWMFIQQEGGIRKTVEKGLAAVGSIRERLRGTKREPTGVRDLIIGAGCGGSNYTSGPVGNMVVGRFFDRLTDLGGATIFEKIMGAMDLKEILVGRATNERVGQEIGDTYNKASEYCKSVHQYSVGPGNFARGLSTVEEKGMGVLIKSRSRPIEGVLKVGVRPPHPGLWLLDSTSDPYRVQSRTTNPNNSEGLIDLVVCHSRIVFLVTGRGSVVGSVVVPCTKITGNSATYRAVEEGMDSDAGPVLEGCCSQDKMAQRLLKMVAEVASDTKSKSEALGHKGYLIPYKYQDRDATKRCRETQAMFDVGSYFSSEGQTAIVTGGTTELGLIITRYMVGAGAKVVVLSCGNWEQEREALKEFGGKTVFYQLDITDAGHTQEMAGRVIAEQGSVIILVNNVRNHCKKYIEDMTAEDYVNVLNVHLVGAFALTKALSPHTKEQGKGSTLFQASMTSYIGQLQTVGYVTAKADYLGLVYTLAVRGGPYGVRVNAIASGRIDTPMFHRATNEDRARLGKILGRIPTQKVGSVTDIGMAAVLLSSDATKYILGTCPPVDGGTPIGF